MECNRDEAIRAKTIAEKKIDDKDFAGAKKFTLKAQTLYPGLDGISQMLITINVFISSENKINGESDWYGVLDVMPSDDDETMKKKYRKLALILHPDKNKSVGADGAFKILSEAWSMLSDKGKRLAYNQRRNLRGFQQKVSFQSARPSADPVFNGFHSFANRATSKPKSQNGTTFTQTHPASVRHKVPKAPARTPAPAAHRTDSFWTICHRCNMNYEYAKIDTLQATFHQWEHVPATSEEKTVLTKELLSNCESIEWQVDELDKAISVAARDPALYGIDQAELERRTKWTRTARILVGNIKKTVTGTSSSTMSGMRQELMRLPSTRKSDRTNHYIAKDNDDFISSESDRQMLLFRQQDEELDELSASVERIGSVGLTIHDELHAQEKLIDELGSEMDSTSNRLDFVQKKVAVVMKKASAKGQTMMILFLTILFIVLFVLVFFT